MSDYIARFNTDAASDEMHETLAMLDKDAQVSAALYVAEMETEHYSWRGYGFTEDEARAAIGDAFFAHLNALNVSEEEREYAGTPATLDELNEYYGVRVSKVKLGAGYRDEQEMTA